ncbi:type VI secretion system baseplate subunit TssF [Paraburkholderia sp. B3]|uniref:type VI secretion system baseplate subunit TssF n=1 Tax=Paraburkholderia sp. B3 TaxID=3134791 RepID=UPI003981BB38
MDLELPERYVHELRYITALFGEFTQGHVKIAARLGVQASEVGNRYVERLLQGAAFINARTCLHIDRWPLEIPLRILEGVNPNFAAPQPSMGVVRFYLDALAAHSPQGLTLPRHTTLTMGEAGDNATLCEFLTSQPVGIWPLGIEYLRFTGIPPDIPSLHRYLHNSDDLTRLRSALRVRLATLNGTPLARLDGLDRLPVYLCGEEALASRLFELIHTSVMGISGEFDQCNLYGAQVPGMPGMRVGYEGLEPDESLLRPVRLKFYGQMQVQEYYALPSRFWFFTLTGLAAGLKRIEGPAVEIVLLLNREVAAFDQQVDASQLALFCAPVTNYFPIMTARLDINPQDTEHRLTPVVDKPDDYGVHSVDFVVGQVNEDSEHIPFRPLDTALSDNTRRSPRYFSLRRELELVGNNECRYDTLQQFVRTHTWLKLLGPAREPDDSDVHHLTLHAWLTNEDLSCVLPRNGVNDLVVKDAKSVAGVGFVHGPTAPRPPLAHGASGDAARELVRRLHLELAVFDDEFHEPSPGQGLSHLPAGRHARAAGHADRWGNAGQSARRNR